MKKYFYLTLLLAVLIFGACSPSTETFLTGLFGWAIGDDLSGTGVILQTSDGGKNWRISGDNAQWNGYHANDVSAVDAFTAWVGLVNGLDNGGKILHTADGGATWNSQTLPVDVPSGIKGIRGLNRREAWAVGLQGPVLHTLDGGETWTVVPTPGISFIQVNRIDVKGNDIWIADQGNGEWGMIHSADGGDTWRQEYLPGVNPGKGPMTIGIVNSQIAWTALNDQGDIYRTTDGGDTWNKDAPDVSGGNDFDDLCAVASDEAWAVQNISGASAGYVVRVKIEDDGYTKTEWNFANYVYEGVSAINAKRAWIGGFRSVGASADLPKGSILYTDDGGQTWTAQTLPVNDVDVWKLSFVGAHR